MTRTSARASSSWTAVARSAHICTVSAFFRSGLDRTSVATLVLSNPLRKNALTVQMWADLATAVQELDARADVRVMVIRGADGNFSSGLDLAYLIEADLTADSTIDPATVTSPAELAITRANTPVVAVIEGHCLGGGALVAIAADIRIASTSA